MKIWWEYCIQIPCECYWRLVELLTQYPCGLIQPCSLHGTFDIQRRNTIVFVHGINKRNYRYSNTGKKYVCRIVLYLNVSGTKEQHLLFMFSIRTYKRMNILKLYIINKRNCYYNLVYYTHPRSYISVFGSVLTTGR